MRNSLYIFLTSLILIYEKGALLAERTPFQLYRRKSFYNFLQVFIEKYSFNGFPIFTCIFSYSAGLKPVGKVFYTYFVENIP